MGLTSLKQKSFIQQLQEERLRLDVQRKKTLQSLSDFYERLSDIKDVKMVLTEFKAQNDALVDYIIELESIWNKLDGELIKQLIANRPKLSPPEYKPREYNGEIRGVQG